MSTILKALQQAEKESRQNTEPPSFDRGLNGMRASNKPAIYISRWVLLISLILLIGGISFLYFLPSAQEKVELPAPDPERKKVVTAPVEPHRPAVIKAMSPAPTSLRLVGSAPMVGPASRPPQTGEKIAQPAPALPSMLERPKSPPVAEPDSVPVAAMSSAVQEVPLLKDLSLKIQAISWDQNPTNRITVINNSILNEGDAIQGFQVSRIEKDAVLLNSNGRNYRLKFHYR